jgi:diguanylate cyclase (GGDEF)-like protein
MDRMRQANGPAAPRGVDGADERQRTTPAGEAVVIVDVDQFAAIRERHGVHACEQVTRAVGDCLRRLLRGEDRLALLREDEFLVVLPGAHEAALPVIEARVREGVKALRLGLAGTVWNLSCTTGAAAHGNHPRGLECLVRAADSALYRAKRLAGGRA